MCKTKFKSFFSLVKFVKCFTNFNVVFHDFLFCELAVSGGDLGGKPNFARSVSALDTSPASVG